MRFWSFHPKHLDTKGLGGVWKEGVQAQGVLIRLQNATSKEEIKKIRYRNHAQLVRFKETGDAVAYMNAYLHLVYEESKKRGFNYNFSLIDGIVPCGMEFSYPIDVTSGQLEYERAFFLQKLKTRSPENYKKLKDIQNLELHPLFSEVDGPIQDWERVKEL